MVNLIPRRCARYDGQTQCLLRLLSMSCVGTVRLGERVRDNDELLGGGRKILASSAKHPQDNRRTRRGDSANLRCGPSEVVARFRHPLGIRKIGTDIRMEKNRLLRLQPEIEEFGDRSAPEIGGKPS